LFDVIVIGGGPAGLSAALLLGRARRRVLVLDAGEPRNASSPAAHSFFSRDGIEPGELLRIGREQLAPYEVEVRHTEATDATREGDGFSVVLKDGAREQGRRLLLATGVRDELPEIPGLREMWGKGAAGCPFCHGWELRDAPIAVLGAGDGALHLARMLTIWSRDVVLLTNGADGLREGDRDELRRLGIGLREARISALRGEDGGLERVLFEDGTSLARRGLFLRPEISQRSPLPERLGCKLAPEGTVEADEAGYTMLVQEFDRGVLLSSPEGPVIYMVVLREYRACKFCGPADLRGYFERFEGRAP
jgi:thioredoxin reductase